MTLTTRDEALLSAVARFRLCRTSDLARLYFSSASPTRAAQRLRALFGARFLDVRLQHLAEENRYSLGERGRAWAKERGLTLGRVPGGRVEHHLAIVCAWTNLAAALGGRPELRLARVRPDWETREAGSHLVVPDLLVELLVGGRPLSVAVEVDRGSERARAWQDKLARYGALHAERRVVLVVLAASAKSAMLERVARQVWRGRVLVMPSSQWPEAMLEAVEGLLTDPVDGKQGEEAASA